MVRIAYIELGFEHRGRGYRWKESEKFIYKRTVMDSKRLLEVTGRDTRPEIELGKD